MKRLTSLILIVSIFLVAAYSVFFASGRSVLPQEGETLSSWADRVVREGLSSIEGLREIAPTLLFYGGDREQDGIFITDEYLLEDIQPGPDEILEENLAGIERFLDGHNIPAYVMLIPTSCAIKQQEVPPMATLYNQKELIGDAYDRLSGKAYLVDVYTDLFAAREQYTYYRTASNLTGLGGYYVYQALARRLGVSPRPLEWFEAEHVVHNYHGDLYQRSPYKNVPPDIITAYHFVKYDRQYKLTHTDAGEQKCYYTLFPTHLKELGDPSKVVLGGFGERIDIEANSPYEESFLIFADRTVLSYLPYLMAHYGDVTVVDLETASDEMLAQLVPEEYDQVMFAFSVDSFIQKNVSGRAALIP